MDAFGVVWENLARYVVGTAPVSQVIAEVIDACEAERAHPSWARLRTLRWDEGQQAVATSVHDLMANQPPPPEARGLWFGISTPVEDGQARSDLYFGATRDYEPDDKELEWVFSGFYYPGTQPHPACLAAMYRIAYDDPNGLGNDAEWPLALAFGCAAVARALRALPVPVTLANESLGVVCGFDGGDFIFLGELARTGLTYSRAFSKPTRFAPHMKRAWASASACLQQRPLARGDLHIPCKAGARGSLPLVVQSATPTARRLRGPPLDRGSPGSRLSCRS